MASVLPFSAASPEFILILTSFECFDTMKSILADDPSDTLDCINKGVVVNRQYINSIDDNKYTMSDGTVFAGRVKTGKKKLEVMKEMMHSRKAHSLDEYSILEKLPLAFCVIELVFDENGRGIDFIFRYCNEEMAVLEGIPVEEMINHSFYEVFKNGDRKWLVHYTDVALNGSSKVIESYSPEIDAQFRVYCFQPQPNYCACALIKI